MINPGLPVDYINTMDLFEKRELKKFLADRYPERGKTEIDTLSDIIGESLDLMSRYDYQWQSVKEALLEEFGPVEGMEALDMLHEHLELYRRFRKL